ncbi:RICIN domain-containing protein [Saccharicrinis sp. GN24d3]|uniref:RICIN domain-containing protein n=1 Tax=Saccharicrinis sp. GN24d3 TaxID=3458416 RepID=UPI00403556B4
MKKTYTLLKDRIVISFLLLFLCLSINAQDISTLSRDQILQRYAPVVHMGVNTSSDYYDAQDMLVRLDHDKNWGTYDDDDDVWANGSNWPRTTLASDIGGFNSNHDVTPIVYTSLLEMSDFYILKYGIYHTYNEIAGSAGDHLNDMESIEVIVDKSGNVKGALTTVHGTTTWGTTWAGDNDMSIFDSYSSSTYNLHLHDGTHPHVWIGSNGAANLLTNSHGHAIFVQNEWMNDRGVDYYYSGASGVDEIDVPRQATSIGYEISNWGYNSDARYLLVPMEELLVKGQMETNIDQMYHIGQSMGASGGNFWGNGWFTFASEGHWEDSNSLRKRYNDSYGGADMGYTYLYKPLADIGHVNPYFQLTNIGGLALPSDISGFYKNSYANIQGSGFFDINGSSSLDLLSMMETATSGNEFTIEAGVRRVGKLWLNENWYSNPFSKNYINGTGPTGGIMLRSGQGRADDFIYIGWAPEKEKIVYIQRSSSVNNGQTTVEYLNISKFNRLFKVDNAQNGTITIFAKDYRKPNDTWVQIKQVDGSSLGLDGNIYGSLVTQSDVNSTANYYWTNAEYVHIKTAGIELDPIVEPGYYKIISKNSGKALDVSGISHDDGANIYQWEYVGQENQQWSIEQIENGKYRIVARHSGKVLDIYSWNPDNGGNVVQWSWVNYENQKWKIEKVDNTYYKISSSFSNKVLDVQGILQDNGANVYQWDYVGQSNQLWKLDKVDNLLKSATVEKIVPQIEKTKQEGIIIYPNPVTDGKLNVMFSAEEDDATQLRILSSDGRVLMQKTEHVMQGENNVGINLSGIKPGIYLVDLTVNSDRKIARLLIK